MDFARLWATGILITIVSAVVALLTLAVGFGLLGLGLATVIPWWLWLVIYLVVYVGVLPIVYGAIAKTVVEWLFD